MPDPRNEALNSIIYAGIRIAAGLTQLVTVIAIAHFTPTEVVGDYAIFVLAVTLVNFALFSPWRHALVRFFGTKAPSDTRDDNQEASLVATVLGGIGASTTLLFVIGLIAWAATGNPLVAVALIAIPAQGGNDLAAEWYWRRSNMSRYLTVIALRASLFVMILPAAAYLTDGVLALVASFTFVHLLVSALFLPRLVRFAEGHKVHWRDWGRLLAYGLPLALAGLLFSASIYADRFLVAHILDQDAVGRYAIVGDLTINAISLIGLGTLLASQVTLLEAGDEAIKSNFSRSFARTAALAAAWMLPAVFGLWFMAPQFASILLPSPYQEEAVPVMRLLGCAAAISALRGTLFDVALMSARRTLMLCLIAGCALAVTASADFFLMPHFALTGAGVAALLGQATAGMISLGLVRVSHQLSWPVLEFTKAAASAAVMALMLDFLAKSGVGGLAGLVAQVGVGVGVYVACMLSFRSQPAADVITALKSYRSKTSDLNSRDAEP